MDLDFWQFEKVKFLVGEEIENCGGESLYVRYLSENSNIHQPVFNEIRKLTWKLA